MRSLTIALVIIAAPLIVGRPVAAAEFDSRFAGESAFLALAPGQSGTFTVFFVNTGTVTWTRSTSTQVDLAACRSDQVTCDISEPGVASFDPGTWLRPGRYATHAQSAVGPGAIGTFVYAVRVPATQPSGTYRFNGDLVVAATGRRIHPEGYYHDLTVAAATCTGPVTIVPAGTVQQVQVGIEVDVSATVTCGGTTPKVAGTNVMFTITPQRTDAGNAPLVIRETTDENGIAVASWTRLNPGSDTVTISIPERSTAAATAYVRWTVAARVLTCEPVGRVEQGGGTTRSFSIIAKDPSTGAPLVSTLIDIAVADYIDSGVATMNGVSAMGKLPGSTVLEVATDSAGGVAIVVTGTNASITPVVFLDENASNTLGASELRVTCGMTVFGRP